MKTIRIHEFGGPEVLSYEDVEIPEPGPGQARVKLAASGVNFIDVYQRTGLYPGDLPRTLGQEGAGEVDAVGEGVDDVSPGDYVAFASTPGSYAEYVVAPAENLVPFNATLVEARVAAAAILQGMTASRYRRTRRRSCTQRPEASGFCSSSSQRCGGRP
jgi:NADPH2:quinone reductase